jgi:hypothetical protein
MLDFKTLFPTKSESAYYSSASMADHKAAARIVRWANADFLCPFDITTQDLSQYADEEDTPAVLELARIKYRLFQYEEFYVGHLDGIHYN